MKKFVATWPNFPLYLMIFNAIDHLDSTTCELPKPRFIRDVDLDSIIVDIDHGNGKSLEMGF